MVTQRLRELSDEHYMPTGAVGEAATKSCQVNRNGNCQERNKEWSVAMNKQKATPPSETNTLQPGSVKEAMSDSVGDDDEIQLNQAEGAIDDGERKDAIDTGNKMHD